MNIRQLINTLETYERICGSVDVTVEKVKENRDGVIIGLKIDHNFEIEDLRNPIKIINGWT